MYVVTVAHSNKKPTQANKSLLFIRFRLIRNDQEILTKVRKAVLWGYVGCCVFGLATRDYRLVSRAW